MEFEEGDVLVPLLDPEKVNPLFNKFSCSVFSRKDCLAVMFYRVPCLICFMMSKRHLSRHLSQSLSTKIACYVILVGTCVGMLIFSRVFCFWILCHKSKITRNMPVPFYFMVGYPQFVLSDHVSNFWSIFEKILGISHKKKREYCYLDMFLYFLRTVLIIFFMNVCL